MRALFCGLIACLALAAPTALAQTPDEGGIAEARALIESEGVADVFEPMADENVEVRHIASGLTCHFYGGERERRLMIFSGQPRGDDVGCALQREGQSITLYATRYAPAITLEQALADAEAGIRDRFADARLTPALLTMSSASLPTPLTRHFLITLNDEQWITSASVAQHGDWIIKVRYTQRAVDHDALMQAQLEMGAIMTLALMELQG